jgi:U4/U6 small nuclear ribonucleoprotein PRP4
MVVPTNDSGVCARLCRLAEPITLFEECKMERHEHFGVLMVHVEVEGKVNLLLRAQEDDQAVVSGRADPVPLLH